MNRKRTAGVGMAFGETVWCLALIGTILFLGSFNLETFPPTWFDEGEFLQIPKNLVLYGRYAIRSSEGFRDFDPGITVGPTFLLPIALVFKLFGIGLLQARLVSLCFTLLTLFMFFRIGDLLYGRRVALTALSLLIVNPNVFGNPLLLGRQVLGDVVAWGFFLAGVMFWLARFPQNKWVRLTLSGMCFGLAIVSKPQFLMIFIPFWGIVVLLTFLFESCCLGIVYCGLYVGIISAVGPATFYAVQIRVLGWAGFLENMRLLRSATATTLTVFSIQGLLRNTAALLSPHFFKLGVIGFIYALALSLRELTVDRRRFLLTIFTLAWMLWFLFFSIGWTRYAFPVYATSNLFLAKLFYDLNGRLASLQLANSKMRVKLLKKWYLLVGINLFLVIIMVVPLGVTTWRIVTNYDRTPQQMAAYLDEHVALDQVIETWEWEVAFLSNGHTYHFPPFPILVHMIAHINLGTPYSYKTYDFQSFDPDYLLLGQFAKYTEVYPSQLIEERCVKIVSVGSYDLYQVHK